jgi:hypothetical protein
VTVFPSPLVPGIQARPVLPRPFRASPDGLCGWFVDGPAGRVGHAFPRVVRDLDGDWFGKRRGVTAKAFPGEVEALAYVCGCDPSEIEVAS